MNDGILDRSEETTAAQDRASEQTAAQNDYVLRSVEERGIRYIQLMFTDVLGIPKAMNITPAELENALLDGMTFDGSAIDGFSRIQESDVLAVPDAQTFQILPDNQGDHIARVFCDIRNLDHTPFGGCPRHVLKRALGEAREHGYTLYASPEIEYFYFADSDPSSAPKPIDKGSYFHLTASDLAGELRKRTVLTLEDMGVPIEYSQHEDAPSQHEIDLRYTDALTMADTVMTVRLVVKEIAAAAGIHASFMPKPLAGVQGSGMHTHFSLFEGDKNAFYEEGDPFLLSKVGRGFIAGLLHHAREITAVTNQWVNSYKRLVSGYEAPIHVSWARNNRSALVRVPPAKRSESTRVEYRAPDPSANPYLTFALILAAGMRGIRDGYDLPAEAASNLYELSPTQLMSDGIQNLPGSLAEAIEVMERSELVQSTLGEHVFEWFIRNKRSEWADYKSHVSQFELDRYFPTL